MPLNTTDITAAEWFPRLRRGHFDVRLFCFPYAGASAFALSRWAHASPRTVDVRPLQLPGRGRRIREPAITRMELLVDAIGMELLPLVDRPYAIFGHSMGALLAFEIVRWLRERQARTPFHLYVSGRRAPHLPGPTYMSPNATDETLIAFLRDLNGTPREVLDEPELIKLLLPALRADLCICRSYVYRDGDPLDCPITAFGGRDDPESTDEHMCGWAKHTAGRFAAFTFPGGHFYLVEQEASLLAKLFDSLVASVRSSPRRTSRACQSQRSRTS